MAEHFGSELDLALREFLEKWGFNFDASRWPTPMYGIMPTLEIGKLLTSGGRPWEEVERGKTFSGTAYQAAVAAQYAQIQLFNPAASGVLAFLTRIVCSHSFQIVQEDVALTTNVTTVASKQGGAAAPNAQMRTKTDVAASTPVIWRSTIDSGGGVTWGRVNFEEKPWTLVEGRGVLVQHDVVNVGIYVDYEWAEVPI